jgi:hypothetical protein
MSQAADSAPVQSRRMQGLMVNRSAGFHASSTAGNRMSARV